MNVLLNETELPFIAVNCLSKYGIHTLDDLLPHDEDSLMQLTRDGIPHPLSRKNMQKVKELIFQYYPKRLNADWVLLPQ